MSSTDADLDAIAALAAHIADAPVALVWLVTPDGPRCRAAFGVVPDAIRLDADGRVGDEPPLGPGAISLPITIHGDEGRALGGLVVARPRAGGEPGDAVARALATVARQAGTTLALAEARARLATPSATEETLRRSEANLARAQHIAHLGSWELDLRDGTLHWSQEIFAIFGVAPSAFGGTYEAFLAAVHPDDRECMDAAQRRALEGAARIDLEHRIVRPDGSTRWVHELGELERDADGRALRLTGTVLDITERRGTERHLERLNRLYRMLSRTNEVIVHEADERALLRAVSQIAVDEGGFRMAAVAHIDPTTQRLEPFVQVGHVAGYFDELGEVTPAEVAASTIATAIRTGRHDVCNDFALDPRVAPWRDAGLARGYRAAASFPIRSEGEAIAALVLYATEPGYFQQDEIDLLVAVADDVSFAVESSRRRRRHLEAEAALAASRRHLQLILESVGEGIHGLDDAGRVVYENRAARDMFGWDGEAMIGRPAHALVHHHRADGAPFPLEACPIMQTLADGAPRRVDDDVFFRRDGTSFPVEYVCTPVTDERGATTGAVVCFRDITERKRADGVLRLEAESLEAISSGAALDRVLTVLVRGVEALVPGAIGAVFVPSADGTHLRLLVAPELPAGSVDPGDAFPIGPAAASSGTAAHRRELVVVSDIASDPLWAPYRRFALPFGLRACWSMPAVDPDGRVWATFTMYHRDVHTPAPADVDIVARAARIARIAIERERKAQELTASEDRIRATFRDAATGIAITTLDGRFLETNTAYRNMLGYDEDELRAADFLSLTHPEDRARNALEIAELLAGRRPSLVITKRYLHKSGRPVWARLSVSLVHDLEGRATGIIGVAEDVTEQRQAEEQLARSQSLLRIAGRITRMGGWAVSVPDHAVLVSEPILEMLELEPSQMPLDQTLELVAPAWRDKLIEALASCELDGTPFDMELEVRTTRGRSLWGRLVGEAERDEQGRIKELHGAFSDITQRREGEAHLRRLETCIAGVNDIVVITEAEPALTGARFGRRVQFVNAAFERVLGYPPSEVLGRTPDLLFGARTDPAELERLHAAMDERRPARAELLCYTKRGEEIWLEVDIVPVFDELGVHTNWVGIERDVTPRKRQEELLREQATLLDRARDAIVVRDLAQRVLYWNRGAERLYGWSAAEVLGSSIVDRLVVDGGAFRGATEVTLARGEWTGELEKRRRDGKHIVVEARWTLVRDEAGAARSILAIDTDVTEKKRLEQQLLRAQRLESVGTLAGGVAHDLNNMLAPILMTASVMLDEETDPQKIEDLRAIEQCARRGADMVRQLLSFARGTDGRRARVHLGDIGHEIRRMVRDTFPKNIAFRLEVAPGVWPLDADPTQIHQLMTNLCVNARDAMPDGGTLSMSVEQITLDEVYTGMTREGRSGPYAIVVVEDTGTGMSSEVVDRIFEPFFTTKDLGKGTGLGLSTVHAIVKSHGGFVHVYSELGRGSRFKVYLPLEAPGGEAPEHEGRDAAPRGDGETVLIVDDEPAILDVARRTLERYGYRVMVAANGAEAIARYALDGDRIDVVLTDMAMPIMDGPATVAALRALDPKVRVVASSGLTSDGGVHRTLEAGVRHFVPKPYTADTLLRVLRRALEDGHPRRET